MLGLIICDLEHSCFVCLPVAFWCFIFYLIIQSLYDDFLIIVFYIYCSFFFFKPKTAYEMLISDWSSDVCSSDLGSLFRDRLGDRLRVGRLVDARRTDQSTEDAVVDPVVGVLQEELQGRHVGEGTLDPGGGSTAVDLDDLTALADHGRARGAAQHDAGRVLGGVDQHEAGQGPQPSGDQGVEELVETCAGVDQLPETGDPRLLALGKQQDRKSQRLNSS